MNTGKVVYDPRTTWDTIVEEACKFKILIRSSTTMWWKIGEPAIRNRSGFPCGPHGERLITIESACRFIEMAPQRAKFYGRHGIAALVAAYHGNIRIDGKPAGFNSWEAYNCIIDLL